jgi:hypothetical protein
MVNVDERARCRQHELLADQVMMLAPPSALSPVREPFALPVGDASRTFTHHIDLDLQTQVARRRREISDAPVIDAPSGISASPCPLFWNFRPISTDVTRAFTCSSSAVIVSFIARKGSSGDGDITSSIVKVPRWD